MKKNTPKKLVLSRETLRRLNESGASLAKGAVPNPDYKKPHDDTGPIYTGPNYSGCPSYGDQCTFTC